MKKRNALLFTLILLVAFVIVACQPETVVETVVVEKEGETIIETVVVEKEGETIIETVVVEKEVEVPGGSSRGSSGTLTILYWQAASTLNPYLSGGTKDIHASSLVLEPLARYDESANLVPWLAEEIPTVENGVQSVNRGSYENPPDLTAENWLKIKFQEVKEGNAVRWLFTRQSCMHCTQAVCVWVCPTGWAETDLYCGADALACCIPGPDC